MNEPAPVLSRRRIFAGAGTAGALAAAAVALPVLREAEPKADAPEAAPAQGNGYRVTRHVLHYYQTARI